MKSEIKDSAELELPNSPEINEIMGHIPSKVLRYGITVILTILMVLLTGSYFITYPEIVVTNITLTTSNSPAPLVAKTDGRIKQLFVADGELVKSGETIALLESTADYSDVQKVNKLLSTLSGNWTENISQIQFDENLTMGEIQDTYLNFIGSYSRLKEWIENPVNGKVKYNKELIRLYKQQSKVGLDQKKVKEEKFAISRKFYQQDSSLYKQNKFGIPQRELELSKQTYLSEKDNLMSFDVVLQGQQIEIMRMENQLNEMLETYQSKKVELIRETIESKRMLENNIKSWCEKFVFTSPINGKLSFTNFWSSNQIIKTGQRLTTIVPEEKSFIMARAYIPSANRGEVQAGQRVDIKLAGFSYLEHGVLPGKVKMVSLVPDEKGYAVEIDLVNGMTSNYSEELKFTHDMEGVAEIMVSNNRLIKQFINF